MLDTGLTYDVLVLGAGLSGIAFARFYLNIHPTSKIAIIDEDTGPGGVWSTSRSYSTFWTQSPIRQTGFSDVPLTIPSDAPRFFHTFESKYVTRYLEKYVDSHLYDGTSLRDRMQFSSRVEALSKNADGIWEVTVEGKAATSLPTSRSVFRARRLAIATGSASLPYIPPLPGLSKTSGYTFELRKKLPSPLSHSSSVPIAPLQQQEEQMPTPSNSSPSEPPLDPDSKPPESSHLPVLHQLDFSRASHAILSSPDIKNVAVLGAGKSAADMVYASAKAGKTVHWIIRSSGEGPPLFTPAGFKVKIKEREKDPKGEKDGWWKTMWKSGSGSGSSEGGREKDQSTLSISKSSTEEPHSRVAVAGGKGGVEAKSLYRIGDESGSSNRTDGKHSITTTSNDTSDSPTPTPDDENGTWKEISLIEAASTRLMLAQRPGAFVPGHLPIRLLHLLPTYPSYLLSHVAEREAKCRSAPQYSSRPGAHPSFPLLYPTASAFWYTGPVALHQRPDFWDVVAQNTIVHRAEIAGLEKHGVLLADDSTNDGNDGDDSNTNQVNDDPETTTQQQPRICADILLCGTGWRQDYPFLTPHQTAALGLPHPAALDDAPTATLWAELLAEADRRVLRRFPVLRYPPPPHRDALQKHSGPVPTQAPTPAPDPATSVQAPEAPAPAAATATAKVKAETTTTRLYRCIVPIDGPHGLAGDQSVVVLGHARVSDMFRTAQAQAVWATGYFDGVVRVPGIDNIRNRNSSSGTGKGKNNGAGSGGDGIRGRGKGMEAGLAKARRSVAYMNAASRRRYPSQGVQGDFLFFEAVFYADRLMGDLGLGSHRRGRLWKGEVKGWLRDWREPCLMEDFKGIDEEYMTKFGSR